MKRSTPLSALPYYREETLRSDGRNIVLSIWLRNPSACTLLFYPGTMASPLLHRFFLQELWRMGCNVAGLHPVGHGASRIGSETFVFEDILRNGLDAADWLRERMDGPVAVTGHSQGGILALAHAMRDQHIAATFPICTLLPQHPQAGMVTRFHNILHRRNQLLAILRAGARWLPRLPVIVPFYLEPRRVLAGIACRLAPRKYMRMSYPLRFVHSLFAADLTDACREGHITCPVVLMTARNDALFSLSLMQTMLEEIKAPGKQLCILSGGGHMAPLCPPYATEAAARMAEHCAGLGLPLYDCGLTTI